ncbi:MAG: tRNA 2-thiouridine(34) synthase MnmA [Candidatus Lightella neohaematopini]|nr:tRNA 2-thiouridine(34) synthase MnmA [Candidatus Lightella neohaematopini]
MKKKKVIVGLSGGVDSSVSAWLLQQKGYHVEGLFMKNWEDNDTIYQCSYAQDLYDTELVCKKLNIKLNIANFSYEYWENVFRLCLIYYKLGYTPNPDVLCNKEIKFKVFLNFALKKLKADYIATGHYVRSIIVDNNYYLLRGIDENKDQSYFLYTIDNNILEKVLFPVGHLTKFQVRSIANKINLSNANKKDSTGICFIGKKKFNSFISKYLKSKPGKIKSVNGNILGNHDGLIYYTIGQRKGIGLGGISGLLSKPWYVVDKDIINNVLIVTQNHKDKKLMSNIVIVNQVNWINQKKLNKPLQCTAKVRYQHKDIRCLVIPNKNDLLVYFYELVLAVTPGQSIVFYLSEYCLGGGFIKKCILCE